MPQPRTNKPPSALPLWEVRTANYAVARTRDRTAPPPQQWVTRFGHPKCARCGEKLGTDELPHRDEAPSCTRCKPLVQPVWEASRGVERQR